MGIPFHGFSHRFLVSLDPDHTRIQPQGCQDDGRDREFQSGNQNAEKVSRNGFEYLLVGSLDAVEGQRILAGSLCCDRTRKQKKHTVGWKERIEQTSNTKR